MHSSGPSTPRDGACWRRGCTPLCEIAHGYVMGRWRGGRAFVSRQNFEPQGTSFHGLLGRGARGSDLRRRPDGRLNLLYAHLIAKASSRRSSRAKDTVYADELHTVDTTAPSVLCVAAIIAPLPRPGRPSQYGRATGTVTRGLGRWVGGQPEARPRTLPVGLADCSGSRSASSAATASPWTT